MDSPSPIILLVEDNPDTARSLAILLQRRGFVVILAVDVHSAIAAGLTQPFDLLLCDIGLPDGDGTEVVAALRQQLTRTRFPAIALTAHNTAKDIETQMEAGFDRHVSKPYLFPDLVAEVRALLHIE